MSGISWRDILLALWFVLWGLLAITNFQFEMSNLILGVLAILIAILTFVRK
jgi:hypothetical protein